MPSARQNTGSTSDLVRFWLYALAYVIAATLVARTLTLFPGEHLLPLARPSPELYNDLEDWLRIGSAGVIHLIPLGCIWFAARCMARLEKERRYAIRLCAAARDATTKVDEIAQISANGKATREDFIRLFGGDFAGGPPMVSDIFDEAVRKSLSGRFEPTMTMLSPYRDTLARDISVLAQWQRISLQAGVLFTFIGLGWGFSIANFQADTSFSNGNAIVDQMLTSLSLAFGTSIAGLLASIAIILMTHSVRRRYAATLDAFADLIQELFDLGRRLPQDKFFIAQLSEISSAVSNSNEVARAVTERVGRLNDTIAAGVSELVSVRDSFDAAVRAIREDQKILGESFKAYVSSLDPAKLRGQIATLIDQHNGSVSSELSRTATILKDTAAALGQITDLAASSNARLVAIENHLTAPRKPADDVPRRSRPASPIQTSEIDLKALTPEPAERIDEPSGPQKTSFWKAFLPGR
ncbi:hypothetical protein J5277_23175 [Rhizobium sp. 16-449-1b]|uniref:hypothetical protein n=1 Tax=Rhizobium sp. 16-449-1b TaxID=2819989 RepID=UPI001ADD587C|nr:hypothetical protein [Rhizobium sp. 16-449-1b]MBO9197020.1 hypothetical protein [Rhizobium sp. 16-449-1b]